MLPTSGYFRGISCPDHDRDYCHRPYCHFRHNPKKEMKNSTPLQSSASTSEVEADKADISHEASKDHPACSTTAMLTEPESPEEQLKEDEQQEPSGSHDEGQSDLIQQLVSEAVKKVLAENPALASSGVDPMSVMKNIDTTALVAQATAEATQANARGKKKYYFRPPDTPSYNPTPIEELNKRKRSADYSEDALGSKEKVVKYTPTPVSSLSATANVTQIEADSKESVESEATDFSSVESEDDLDKRKCDFDILEEVLAEHSQNNKVKVKKKRVKALGKLQYSLSMPEKRVDESSMISDARNLSDQDSNTCDIPLPRTNSIEDKLPTEGSYFLPPSPVFTSSSDGFGAFNSVVYTKSNTSPEDCEPSDNRMLMEKKKADSSRENSDVEDSSPPAVKQSKLPVKTDKKVSCKEDSKKKTQGHTHLPQVVHTLGAPKLSRPNIRSWTPQVRGSASDARKEGDPLEEMLQLMDGNDAANKEKKKESCKHSESRTDEPGESTKSKRKYKVDLDKEIESLTNPSSPKKGEFSSSGNVELSTEVSNKLTEVSMNPDAVPDSEDISQVCKGKTNNRKKESEKIILEEKNRKMEVKEKDTGKHSPSYPSDTELKEESNDDDSVAGEKTTEDSNDSHEERGRHKKKRKRSYSTSSDSDHAHHRKKRKKSHKRNRKHSRSKKRRKRRDSRSDSSDSDNYSEKDGKDDDGNDKSEASGEKYNDDETEKPKKHKKHRKKSKHRKKAKHKRKKGKTKSKKKDRSIQSRTRSSSRNRSRNSSRNKSRSSSRNRSQSSSENNSRSSSRNKSRSSSRHRSRSSSIHSSRSSSRHSSRSSSKVSSRNSSKHKSRSPSKDRCGRSSKDRSKNSSKDRSKSPNRDRSRSSSKQRSRCSSKHRRSLSKNRSRSLSKNRTRSLSRNRSQSPSEGKGKSISKRSRSRSRSKNRYTSKSQCRKEHDAKTQNESKSFSKDRSKSPNKDRSRSSSKQRSRCFSKYRSCLSKNRSRSLSKNRTSSSSKSRSQSPSEGRGESINKRSRSRSRSKSRYTSKLQCRKEHDAKTRNESKVSKESVYGENIQPISTPMPIDPSKIKVEKDVLVPDLSLVKIEKVDEEESSSAHLRNAEKKSISEVHEKSNELDIKNVLSSNRKSSIETKRDSENLRQKDKEHVRLSSERKSKRRDSHERKNSTESISEKMPASNRRCSTDSKKSDAEITVEKKKVSERRISTDKNNGKGSSTASDPQPKVMSMFDMVVASSRPAKPKSLTEISIFDSLLNTSTQDVSTDSSRAPSDDDDVNQKKLQASDTQESSVDEMFSQRKRTLSQSNVKSKSESGSKAEKVNDHQRSSSNQSTKSSHNHSNLSSKDVKHESRHAHASSTKHKSSSHHSSGTHSGSPSRHKSMNSGSSSSKQHQNSSTDSKSVSGSSSSKQHQNSSTDSKSVSDKTYSLCNSKRKEGKLDNSSSYSGSSSKHYHSSKKSSNSSSSNSSGNKHGSNKHSRGSRHKDKGHSRTEDLKIKTEKKPDEVTISQQTSIPESSSDGISDRDLYSYNETTGNESPLPDLSVLDEIPQDDWEQMISSTDKVDMKHLENLRNFGDSDLDELDREDPKIMEECLKMFNEYEPPEELEAQPLSKKARTQSVDEEPDPLPGKSRTARTNSTGNLIPKKPSSLQQRKKTPAQMMMERYEKLKEQQAKLMEQLKKQKKQLDEQCRNTSIASAKSSVSSASSHSTPMSPPNSSSAGGTKRRISHVPNVSSLLEAGEKMKSVRVARSRSLLSPSVAKASGVIPQTIAQTATKGSKRIAHIPKAETLKRPVIPAEFGSKVPQNIRQRYLNSIIDECLKFCGEKEAFNIAVAEERVCFKRSSSRMIYLNLAVNAVKRLRTQQTAGEAAQELLNNEPQFAENLYAEEPQPVVKPSTSGALSSQSKGAKQHPVNPNHVKLSHFTVLSGGGQRGSWSIEKPKKNSCDVQDSLKGEAFYKLLLKYLMTEEQLGENGFPLADPEEKGKAIIKSVDSRKKISPSSVERYCDRCSVLYMVDKWGFPTSTGPCVHHWGRANKRRTYSGIEARYFCCGGDLESEGCCQATTHVSQNYNPSELRGFVRTLPKDTTGIDHGVYALDCEMCYTTAGNELTRVTIINTEGDTVLEQLVKPDNPIIDYNTRFSGITEGDMVDVKTTIRDVQASILTLFSDKTILIGHSLESDFHALKLIHDTVVDTSVVFPHKMGPPYKRALRNLASEYLKTIIQNDVSGHDSAEDALTCMRLMKWRIKEDLKGLK